MRLSFVCNTVLDGWTPHDKRLGGTEESIVKWGEEFAQRGHQVTIYQNGFRGTFANCKYSNRNLYKGGEDFCINVKSSDIKPKVPTLYLTNETNANEIDLSAYKGVILPSQWAVDNIPVNNKTFVVPHGYDSDKISPAKKVRKQCLYASSPDRGLELLQHIWPAVVDQHPDAHLYVTYGGKLDTPNTTCGEFSEAEMNKLYNESEFWLHPATGGELFGISGVKAQMAGAIPIYFPTMALRETVKVGLKCTGIREMHDALILNLSNEKRKDELRLELSRLDLPDWQVSTDILEDVILEVYGNNR